MPYLVLRGVPVLLQKGDERHQNAGRAVAALQTVRLPKRLLDRMKLIRAGRQTFHGGDAMSIRLDRKDQTRARRLAIEQDRTCAADPVLAAHVCTRQPQLMAQEVAEQEAWLHVTGVIFFVDSNSDRYGLCHSGFASPARCTAIRRAFFVKTFAR